MDDPNWFLNLLVDYKRAADNYRPIVRALLRRLGITYVTLRYSGDGQLTTLRLESGGDPVRVEALADYRLPPPEKTMVAAHGTHELGQHDIPVSDALEHLFFDYVASLDCGWQYNEDLHGELEWDIESDRMNLAHNDDTEHAL